MQYLGVSRDPESGLPVLLMELMDSSLTQFLERSEEPLPFHITVDICHDIALALAYLHSNGILHRDLSSNNVLLIGPGNRAKVTDFGMSKLADANLRMTPMTMCPGTLAYMPPEALDDPPVYTNKLDCFSFGVLDIQILTRQFPDPTQRFKTIEISDPRAPYGSVKVPVPEVERRQSHIDRVNPAHPLLPVTLNCLKDKDSERPSAQELCHRLAALKEAPQYSESVLQAQRATTDGESVQIRELRAEAQREMGQQYRQQIEILQQEIQEISDRTIVMSERQLQEKDRIIEEKDHVIVTREMKFRQLNQQLQMNEQVIANFQSKDLESDKTIQDLQQNLVAKDQQITELQQQNYDQSTAKLLVRGQSAREGPLSLHWSKYHAPCEMSRLSVVVDGNTAYFTEHNGVYSYDSEEQIWSSLPECPHRYSSLAVVNGLLTAIGGNLDRDVTNRLLNLTGEGKWVEQFPPMPTKRYATAAVCSGKSLVVAGGKGNDYNDFSTVEVMEIETLQWSNASSLPFGVAYASATICEDRIYLLGYTTNNEPRCVLACSMADLQQSCQPQSLGARFQALTLRTVWHRVANLPVRFSGCATLGGQLLAVGGCVISFQNHSTAIHQYNPATNSWEVISNMPTARSYPLVAVLPGNKLMVVGGYTDTISESDIVEIATLQE